MRYYKAVMASLAVVSLLFVSGIVLLLTGHFPSSLRLRLPDRRGETVAVSGIDDETGERKPSKTPTPSPSPVPTVTTGPSLSEKYMKTDWRLVFVNRTTPVSDEIDPSLTEFGEGKKYTLDSRIAPLAEKMLADCRAAGLDPRVVSAYRSEEYQRTLYDNKVRSIMSEKHVSREEAEAVAETEVAFPGTSEHQLGLALDIVQADMVVLERKQQDTEVQKWLMANSWKYGFVLRYPDNKIDITGIIYEPWHYRFVGMVAAEEMYKEGICLEEYLIKHHVYESISVSEQENTRAS